MAPTTKTIDGLSVTCASLEPADAYDLMPELAPLFGSFFAAKSLLKKTPDGTHAVNTDDIAQVLIDAGRHLGGGKITDLLIKLMRTTVVVAPGEAGAFKHEIRDRATFNLAFSGKLWSPFKVAALAFEVTYGNFSDVAAQLAGATRTP